MPNVPGLRSIYHKTGGLVYFGRMIDKIRLHAAGRLPSDYIDNLGTAFDGRCCNFLGVDYTALRDRVLAGGTDDEIMAWCLEIGAPRTDEEREVWNGFMMKRGWRDAGNSVLQRRIKESGFEHKLIETMFDYIEFDEGRDPAACRAWEQ
ncbi:MAG: DUF5069 domain-containing protein [Opitutaceae bacterium]|nr:DUF5069 domain-containing protein [Opitutaceae bacterium]